MSDLRTRLARAICDIMLPNYSCGCVDAPCCYEISLVFDAVLAVLASPSDADVEQVARGLLDSMGQGPWELEDVARAAIRALVGEAS